MRKLTKLRAPSLRFRSSNLFRISDFEFRIYLRHFKMIENSLQQVFRRNVLRLGFIGDDQAVTKHVVADRLDVLGRDIPAPFEKSQPFRRPSEKNRRPRTGAVLDVRSDVE